MTQEQMKSTFISLRKEILNKEFARMNPMQKQAVFHTQGPLLILAGAGSGKTTVLVNRIANLIQYGDAYNSDKAPYLTEDDIEFLQEYLRGESTDGDAERARALLGVNCVRPWQILAITFTNKAAGELKERLNAKIGPEANDIWASTFHSACARILRRDGGHLGYTSHFTVYDTDDSRRLMKDCQRRLGIEDKILSHKLILNEISRAKDALISPEEYLQQAGADFRMKNIGRAYQMYQSMLKSADAMDFDDLLVQTVALLRENEDIRDFYQRKFRFVLVDEYQDTNHAQYVLTSLLATEHKNICVVGDDDQSIYRFRGATIENILSFEKQYPDAKVIRLEQNYRSTQTILDAANAVISHNTARKGKKLWTDNGAGEKIILKTAFSERDEAKYIADTILESVAGGRKWSDHSVLYRMNAQSNTMETMFLKMGIPYKVVGGFRFYDRKEIKDALAYLAVINNPADDVRLKRIINEPKRSIGDTTVAHAAEIAAGIGVPLFEVLSTANEYEVLRRSAAKLMQFAQMITQLSEDAEELALHELFAEVLDKTGYRAMLECDKEQGPDRLANLDELSTNILHYEQENEEPDLSGFLEEVSLISDLDSLDEQADRVVMMTLHSAKGLEFPVVFIAGMEDGIFPGAQSIYNPDDLEEERRLAYVGITRTKQQLYITNAETRMIYGQTNRNRPSRFLQEIPSELMLNKNIRIVKAPSAEPKKAEPQRTRGFGVPYGGQSGAAQPAQSYRVGDTVEHKSFGVGVILSAQKIANDTLLEIAFDRAGTKKLMANFAKLTKKQ